MNTSCSVIQTELKPRPNLITPVGTTIVAATTTLFVARDNFVVNIGENALVNISSLGNNFEKWFLCKEEPAFKGSTLNYGRLSRSSMDGAIIETLGGEDKAKITLTEVSALMKAQKNGEDGALLTNGNINLSYVPDFTETLRAVYWGWDKRGWVVDACFVPRRLMWLVGRQVFSPDSRSSSVI